MGEVICFVIGAVLGGIVGVTTMCMLQIRRIHRWEEKNDVKEND